MSVSAGNDQGQQRKLQLMVPLLSLFEKHGVNVAWLLEGTGPIFKKAYD